MPAYNFQERFASAVERGDKKQTIRSWNRGAVPGARAFLYTGMRTSKCRKLGESIITGVHPIEIGRNCGEPYAVVDERGKTLHLKHDDLDAMARADGFEDRMAMVEWFEGQYGLPYNGFLHQWE